MSSMKKLQSKFNELEELIESDKRIREIKKQLPGPRYDNNNKSIHKRPSPIIINKNLIVSEHNSSPCEGSGFTPPPAPKRDLYKTRFPSIKTVKQHSYQSHYHMKKKKKNNIKLPKII
jgi:hypothetical protein